VPDYLRFSSDALNNGELDGARAACSNRRAHRRQRFAASDPCGARPKDGLGPRQRQRGTRSNSGHIPGKRGDGWDGSAGTIFWVDPGTQLVTILMTQSSPANPTVSRERFKTLVEESRIAGK
jgi:CubicO group peptidase (beta-lactamase class C family)